MIHGCESMEEGEDSFQSSFYRNSSWDFCPPNLGSFLLSMLASSHTSLANLSHVLYRIFRCFNTWLKITIATGYRWPCSNKTKPFFLKVALKWVWTSSHWTAVMHMFSLDFRVQLPNKNLLKNYSFVCLIITKF